MVPRPDNEVVSGLGLLIAIAHVLFVVRKRPRLIVIIVSRDAENRN